MTRLQKNKMALAVILVSKSTVTYVDEYEYTLDNWLPT